MRWILLLIGVLFGAGATAITTVHGWHLGSTPEGSATFALIFCAVSVFALTSPMVAAVMLRRTQGARRWWVVPYGVLALMAFAGNAVNSLDAIVTRFDKTIAGRQGEGDSRRSARAELDRALSDRKAVPAFRPMTREGVEAARAALSSAEVDRKRECAMRGNWNGCSSREVGETRARAEHTQAIADFASATRADELDRRISALRAQLGSSPAATAADPLANAVARFLHIAEGDASTLRWFYMSLLIELAVALFLFGFELLDGRQAPSPAMESQKDAAAVVEAPKQAPKPPTIAAKPQGDTVGRFALACLPREVGGAESLGNIYKRYLAYCASTGADGLPVNDFATRFKELCAKARIRVETRNGKFYCLDVRLTA